MKRAKAYLTMAVGLGGMLLLAGASQGQGPGGAAPPPAGGAPAANTARPTIAVFNMAAVMREFGQAKYQVYQLNEKRKGMSKDIVAWRAEYIKLQEQVPMQQVPTEKEKMTRRMVDLSRQIQDKESLVNKALNDEASAIISKLYDQIKTVVDKTAEMNGYHIVFAYPDAVTAEEANSPMVKELKLKPPAAQPFFVAKHVDLTGVVVQTLNAWYPAPAVPAEPAPAGPAPAGGVPGAPPKPPGTP